MDKSLPEFNQTISCCSSLDENEDCLSSNSPFWFNKTQCSPPQLIDDIDCSFGSEFWNASTPPQFYALHARLVRASLKSKKDQNGYSLYSASSIITSSQPEDPIRRSLKKKPQACKTKSLTIITTTLQTVTENPISWINKRHFKSSVKVYICRIPKELLTNAIIRQTMLFKPHVTLRNLRMQQKLIYRSRVIERWLFEKGFVHSNVITVWETRMRQTQNLKFFSNPTLTGHAAICTEFYDGNVLLDKYKTFIVFK